MSLKREPLQIVEIDVDYCSLTYGSGACTAALGSTGVRKCFNTFRTCQDQNNFDRTTLTLRFAQNQSGLPRTDPPVMPAMAGPVSTNPTQINLGGISDRKGPLGRRATVTVNLRDFQYSDIGVDKYALERRDGTAQTDEGGYKPEERGTFFAKLRRRWPYYAGKALRVRDGYVGDALGDMTVRHYVITEWKGPNAAGNVTIEAADILDLADNDKAKCPEPSRGKLAKGMSDGSGQFSVTPSGIGSEYPTTGRVSIGSEVLTYTRSGDTFTVLSRGVDGTEASSHSEGDLVQVCYRVVNQRIDLVAKELLEDYAGIDAAWIPAGDWEDEALRWLAGFDLTRTIPKPEGVQDLLAELAQLGVVWWWDEEARQIRMRANRPLDLGETAPAITDERHVVENTLRNEDRDDERITRVIFWHGLLDPSGSTTDGSNYGIAQVVLDTDAESADEYDGQRVHEIYSPWLGAGSSSVATAVASRLLNRYRETPREVRFDVDIAAKDSIAPADLITLTSRVLQDETGQSLATEMQVTSLEEVQTGHRLRVVAQSFQFRGRFGFITETSAPEYGSATDAEKAEGAWIAPDADGFADGTGPYLIF